METSLSVIFINSMLAENIALFYFLGICPLISLTDDIKASFNMGITVFMVMIVTSSANWFIYNTILVPAEIQDLKLLFFVLTIACTVGLIESFLDRFFPDIHADFGVFLPLLTVNCAILGISLFAEIRQYSFLQTAAFSTGSGTGWLLAITLLALVKKRIHMDYVPASLGKTGISMILAAVISIAFSGLTQLLVLNGG